MSHFAAQFTTMRLRFVEFNKELVMKACTSRFINCVFFPVLLVLEVFCLYKNNKFNFEPPQKYINFLENIVLTCFISTRSNPFHNKRSDLDS